MPITYKKTIALLEGHCEIVFRNVRVPASNLLGEEGSGFALADAAL